ncbi:MAG: HD domain-containing protein [Candidatus Omnitrophica bacterium]|nr:HD domain-containing protein [Candidatus Omnitrophota bacterium]MCB9720289.1 HD domain-containing protein [Candidatus Omnitrophota bacterium]
MATYKTIAKTVKAEDGREIHYTEVLTGLTYALDLPLAQPAGHTLRTCWIGMHIGRQLDLKPDQLWELYYTLLLKDAGGSRIGSRLFELFYNDDLVVQHAYRKLNRQQFKDVLRFLNKHAGIFEGTFGQLSRIINLLIQWKSVTAELSKIKGEAGAEIAKNLDFPEAVAAAIRAVDEHFNGKGQPQGLEGDKIPLYARIALLAQVVDAIHADDGKDAALAEAEARSGTWFDPQVVAAFKTVAEGDAFWAGLTSAELRAAVVKLEPKDKVIILTEEKLDDLAQAFGVIIDNKSDFTKGHSGRVAEYAEAIGKLDGMDMPSLRQLKRAALLHDLGRLGISNAILDKPVAITKTEHEMTQKHAVWSEEILGRISIFRQLAVVAGAHHERLDGLGYPNGKKKDDIPGDSRIITVADIYDALTTTRPHRGRMDNPKAFEILNGMRDGALEGKYVDLLRKNVE